MCECVFVCAQREREKEADTHTHTHKYNKIHTVTHTNKLLDAINHN